MDYPDSAPTDAERSSRLPAQSLARIEDLRKTMRRGSLNIPEYQTYNYEPLPRKPGAIRLLNLLPSTPESPDVYCELIIQEDKTNLEYKYEALSWCWGTAGKTKYISIRDKKKVYAKYIQRNLWRALRALRYLTKCRYLWIDAICIDQENLDEKNHQVEMMHQIYGKAERVCIWLGKENESSRMALQFIKREVLQLQNFDRLCDSKDASQKWRSLLELMQRPWFSRRWVVQEIALARTAVIYCGSDRISWKKFAIAVELFVEVESATHRLSEVMEKDSASLLVDAIERLFGNKEHMRATESEESVVYLSDSEADSDAGTTELEDSSDDMSISRRKKHILNVDKTTIQPLLSLEYLVSSLTIFNTTVPHDTIYALLAISKDTTPKAVRSDLVEVAEQARGRLEFFTQRKSYNVDYKLPYVDVCKDFIQFSIRRGQRVDRSRALDILCRPWATEEKVLSDLRRRKVQEQERKEKKERIVKERERRRRERQKEAVVPSYDKSQKPATESPSQPSTEKRDVSTEETKKKDTEPDIDPNMKLPSWVPQLSAAPYAIDRYPGIEGPKMIRKNADPLVGLPNSNQRNYSAAESKCIDRKTLRFRKRKDHFSMYVQGFELDERSRWEESASLLLRACKEAFKKGGFASGAVNTTGLLHFERNSVVAEFCRRVQAVTWNRRLVTTAEGRLGLVRKGVEKGDKVCILYGCSVPLILRQSERKDDDTFQTELQSELKFITDTIATLYRQYAERKRKHERRKDRGMNPILRQWLKDTEWLRHNGLSKVDWLSSRENQKCHGNDLLTRALEAFREWKVLKRLKEWPPIKEKIEKDKKAKEQKPKKGKLLMDEIIERQKKRRHEERQRRERQKIQISEDSKGGIIEDGRRGEPSNKVSASRKVDGKHKSPIDWWDFEYQLKAGRRWRRIVKDRKASMASRGATSAEEHWQKQKTAEWESFKSCRMSQGTYLVRYKGDWVTNKEQKARKEQEAFEEREAWKKREALEQQNSDTFTKSRRPLKHSLTWASYGHIQGIPEADEDHDTIDTSDAAISTQSVENPEDADSKLRIADPSENIHEASNGHSTEITNGKEKVTVVGDIISNGMEQIRPGWVVRKRREDMDPMKIPDFDTAIRKKLEEKLGEEGYFSYQMLGECYIHGMMDGEAMLFQNEGDDEVIPSIVFEMR
ncbi:HET-domain-containing protein [Lophiostoma macrostomum CBS 122681]|uniref:HET-domain-containing protein n=1 Tax=Lophiostoma macrostomum CBS 122681 TaxID=1314788 RepID=A0A6A6SLF1_9PLEO|nr:HET-domain-containing protein [Lophiostoma macrostomum CBS 122681]